MVMQNESRVSRVMAAGPYGRTRAESMSQRLPCIAFFASRTRASLRR